MIVRVLNEGYGYTICPRDWNYSWPASPFHRFYYALGGSGRYSSPTKELEFVPGNLYILPSFTPYSVRHDPLDPFEVLYFHIDVIPDIADDIFCVPVKKGGLEHSLLQTLGHFSGIRDLQSLTELCTVLVRYIVETYNPAIVPLIGSEPRLEKVIRFIELNRDKKITAEALAEIACMERAYFTRFFKRHYKIAPADYVRRRKMILAAEKLLAGVSAEDIAEAIAYGDEKAFSRAFKRVYGIPPREYRKSHKLQP